MKDALSPSGRFEGYNVDMSDRRSTKPKAPHFTLEDLRVNRSRAVTAAKKDGGCIVVDNQGQRLLSLWIPQEPLYCGD